MKKKNYISFFICLIALSLFHQSLCGMEGALKQLQEKLGELKGDDGKSTGIVGLHKNLKATEEKLEKLQEVLVTLKDQITVTSTDIPEAPKFEEEAEEEKKEEKKETKVETKTVEGKTALFADIKKGKKLKKIIPIPTTPVQELEKIYAEYIPEEKKLLKITAEGLASAVGKKEENIQLTDIKSLSDKLADEIKGQDLIQKGFLELYSVNDELIKANFNSYDKIKADMQNSFETYIKANAALFKTDSFLRKIIIELKDVSDTFLTTISSIESSSQATLGVYVTQFKRQLRHLIQKDQYFNIIKIFFRLKEKSECPANFHNLIDSIKNEETQKNDDQKTLINEKNKIIQRIEIQLTDLFEEIMNTGIDSLAFNISNIIGPRIEELEKPKFLNDAESIIKQKIDKSIDLINKLKALKDDELGYKTKILQSFADLDTATTEPKTFIKSIETTLSEIKSEIHKSLEIKKLKDLAKEIKKSQKFVPLSFKIRQKIQEIKELKKIEGDINTSIKDFETQKGEKITEIKVELKKTIIALSSPTIKRNASFKKDFPFTHDYIIKEEKNINHDDVTRTRSLIGKITKLDLSKKIKTKEGQKTLIAKTMIQNTIPSSNHLAELLKHLNSNDINNVEIEEKELKSLNEYKDEIKQSLKNLNVPITDSIDAIQNYFDKHKNVTSNELESIFQNAFSALEIRTLVQKAELMQKEKLSDLLPNLENLKSDINMELTKRKPFTSLILQEIQNICNDGSIKNLEKFIDAISAQIKESKFFTVKNRISESISHVKELHNKAEFNFIKEIIVTQINKLKDEKNIDDLISDDTLKKAQEKINFRYLESARLTKKLETKINNSGELWDIKTELKSIRELQKEQTLTLEDMVKIVRIYFFPHEKIQNEIKMLTTATSDTPAELKDEKDTVFITLRNAIEKEIKELDFKALSSIYLKRKNQLNNLLEKVDEKISGLVLDETDIKLALPFIQSIKQAIFNLFIIPDNETFNKQYKAINEDITNPDRFTKKITETIAKEKEKKPAEKSALTIEEEKQANEFVKDEETLKKTLENKSTLAILVKIIKNKNESYLTKVKELLDKLGGSGVEVLKLDMSEEELKSELKDIVDYL